jgi:hypothetical protein
MSRRVSDIVVMLIIGIVLTGMLLVAVAQIVMAVSDAG